MTPNSKLLVVDDEPAIRRLVRGALVRAGYEVVEAGSASEGLTAIEANAPELVLLDLGLPDRDGMELVPLAKQAGAAVLVLTARDATAEKVAALDLGADDYVTKPFDTQELLARVRTCLRHRRSGALGTEIASIGDVEIDFGKHRVRSAGKEVHLTRKEFSLLSELARHRGRVVTHTHLLRTIWGPAHEKDVEYLRVAVRSLRTKLEQDPSDPRLIMNEPGVGYRLTDRAS
jgi:two-component system, OmpR family, KDP operon response regulator KdpE